MDLVDRDVLIKVLATQRVKAGAVQKRARNPYQIENAEHVAKKVRSDRPHARDDVTDIERQICGQNSAENSSSRIAQGVESISPSAINTDAECMVVGKGEISSTGFQNYAGTQSKPSLNDQPSLKSPATVRKENRSPPPSRTDTSTDSPRIDHSPLPPGATSSAIRVTDLLNGDTSSAKHANPLQSTLPATESSAPPSTDTSRRHWQNDTSADLQLHTKTFISSRPQYSNTLSSISTPPKSPVSYDQVSRPSEPASPHGSVIDSASGLSNDKLRLEEKFVDEKLAVLGRILMPKRNTPDSFVMLPVHTLLSQDVLGFFHLYSLVAGVGEVSVLSFDLTEVTWQRDRLRKISRGDSDAFRALKQTIWGCLCVLLRGDPELAIFKVMVTSPTQHVANNTVAISKPPSNESEAVSGPEPLTKLVHHNPAATSNTKPVHVPASTPQAPVPIIRSSHHERTPHKEPQPTPQSRETNLAREQKHPTTRLLAPPTSGCSPPRRTPGNHLSALQIAPAPQCFYPLAGPTHPDEQFSSVMKIIVRIQLNGHGEFSGRYNRNVLLSTITNVDFFAWFASHADYAHNSVPAELEFTFKDSLPMPKYNKVTMGNEEHFEYMKQDVKRQFEQATVLMAELIEFAVLVTVPGRVVEQQGVEWRTEKAMG